MKDLKTKLKPIVEELLAEGGDKKAYSDIMKAVDSTMKSFKKVDSEMVKLFKAVRKSPLNVKDGYIEYVERAEKYLEKAYDELEDLGANSEMARDGVQ